MTALLVLLAVFFWVLGVYAATGRLWELFVLFLAAGTVFIYLAVLPA